MHKEFTNLDELLEWTKRDKSISGSEAFNANRYPIRFVLFDNFRDSYDYANFLSGQQGCHFVSVNQWMDSVYPDVLVTYSKLVDCIKRYVGKEAAPSEDYLITPFSELARFYNNKTESKFDALIGTLKNIQSSQEAYDKNQRIYIPIVGLEGKFSRFEHDSQIHVWYYKNTDKQLNYRLIMTNDTDYGVKGLPSQFTQVGTILEWLDVWRNNTCKTDIISMSPAIYANAEYADPDNAFSFLQCDNVYDFLTKGLRLDFGAVEYKPAEEEYWEELALKIDIRDFNFDSFFNTYFHIDNLADYSVFLKAWFDHVQLFERWLLTKYYIARFCNKGYICQVINATEGLNDYQFFEATALTIFKVDNPEDLLDERKVCMDVAKKRNIRLSKEVQDSLEEALINLANEQGYATAIRYMTTLTMTEKRLMAEWYGNGHIGQDDIVKYFPELGAYLGKSAWPVEKETQWTHQYFDCYKQARLRNEYTLDVQTFIQEKNGNEAKFVHWYQQFKTTKTILQNRFDIQHYYWIDGLGIDWIPYVKALMEEVQGMYLNEIHIARASCPTTTYDNKDALFDIANNDLAKIGSLDDHAHKVVPYPVGLIEEMEIVEKAIREIISYYAGGTIAIVSDHGLTALSQYCDGLNLSGVTSDHHGRIATRTTGKVVGDEYYITLDDNRMCALTHKSLCAKVPTGQSAHGGCTPEEVLVPILVFSAQKKIYNYSVELISAQVLVNNPVLTFVIKGLTSSSDTPFVTYNGADYELHSNSSDTFQSGRIMFLNSHATVTIHIGDYQQKFEIEILTGAEEDDLFGDNI